MKINLKKIFTALFAGSLLFGAITACNMNANTGSGGATTDVIVKVEPFEVSDNPVQMAKNMKIGWNLGNAFDANGLYDKSTNNDWAYKEGLKMEYNWLPHKQATSRNLIKAVRAAGFNTIRIPVSWHNHMSRTSTEYTIDSKWMNRVKEVVDWSIEEGMCVIINIHHDNLHDDDMAYNPGFCITTDAELQEKSISYIEKVWNQIATVFKDYDNKLVFELLNEPRCVGTAMEWGFWNNDKGNNAGKETVYCPIITKYEQAALNVIRGTGGNNTTRYVMAPGYAASPAYLSSYTLPVEPAVSAANGKSRILLATHAYTPTDFCLDGAKSDYDSNKSVIESAITSEFNNLKTNYVAKGIGVVMGEASASDKNNLESRVKWANYYFAKAAAAGIPIILWDNEQAVSMGATAGGENHGYFNRVTCVQTWPSMIEAMMKTVYDAEDISTKGDAGSDTPETPVGDVVVFDAANDAAPAGTSIVTIDGVKYLKVIPDGYNTSFDIPAVNVTAGKKIVVTMKADANTTGVQAVVKVMIGWDPICTENTDPAMNPLSSTAKDYESTVVASGAVNKVQPMVQNTSDWSARSDTAIYISKIIVK